MSTSISIILVEPESPGNIGAVARAMKNMGLKDLRLVGPPPDWKEKGKKMAMSAYNVLKKAVVFDQLQEALRDTSLAVGTTRRFGAKRGMFVPFPEAIKKMRKASLKNRVAIVFGKESKGLDNPSLNQCDFITTIPSHSSYPSLNLAQSVMVIAFSLFQNNRRIDKASDNGRIYVSKGDIQDVLGNFREALLSLDYGKNDHDVLDRILATFRGMLKRSHLLRSEAKMLKALSYRIREKVSHT